MTPEDKLKSSGISIEDADRAGIGYTENAKLVDLGFSRAPAIVIPYTHPTTLQPMTCEGSGRPFVRIRYLEEVLSHEGKVVRYSQPKASGVKAYFPAVLDWKAVFADPTWPVVITEGEFKALALCLQGVACIGLGGVWNWRWNDELLEELSDVDWQNRPTVLCYDSDAESNPQVRVAELTLAAELQRRGADSRLCRLQPSPDGSKRGVDDYIAQGRGTDLLKLLESAEFIPSIDQAVLELNKEIAFLESEDCVYIVADDRRITKSAFQHGSRWSSMTVSVAKSVKGKVVEAEAALAPLWLRHPSARRYAGTIFDPSTDERDIITDTGVMLNRWRGFKSEPGDVTPFLELTAHLMQNTPEEHRDLPLRMMAYKAQHPDEKFPLALVFIGKPGSGKSAWPKCIAKAFAPYGIVVPSAALKSDFNEFLECSLFAVIDEAQAVHTAGARDVLKNLISEKAARLNKKHVSATQVETFTQFALTANDRGVGAFEGDDRRMVVVGCPPPLPDAFYDELFNWLNSGGNLRLMHYLLTYDLKGWTPPKKAPVTAEKLMANQESLTPVEVLANDMLTADENVIRRWLDAATSWAQQATNGGGPEENKHAKAVLAMASSMQVRPFYTPDELAMLFPAIVGMLHGAKRLDGTPSGAISRALRNAGIGYLRSRDDERGFRWQGGWKQFLVIADMADWQAPLGQSEFEMYMRNFPLYRPGAARTLQRVQ